MKPIKLFLCLATAYLLSMNIFAQLDESVQKEDANRNDPEQQEWLRDLGFGMFIHWSLDSQLGIVISHSLVGASDDYTKRFFNELPQTFDPIDFDPYKIAIQAKLAGMKYVVFTTKHHSGFCMWDTQTTNFNITNTPYKKDLLKEYVEGVRKAGLAVGFYYSPEDFKFLSDNHITVKRRNLHLSDEIKEKYNDLIQNQTHELFSNYGPIDILFIDGHPKERCKKIAWDLQPNLVITRGAISTPEQKLPGVADDNLWESCVTMGTQWQYKPTNDKLKSADRVIDMFIETRAKGGNLLLNIGLNPWGEIPDPESRNLSELAAWYFINQEAIINVRPWIILHENNIWYTASKDKKTVYAIIKGEKGWSRGERKDFILTSVKATPQTKIYVLGQNDKVVEYKTTDAKSTFKMKDDGLHISVVRAQRIYNNNKWPNPVVVRLENIEPALDPPVVQTNSARLKNNTLILSGQLLNKGDNENLMFAFEYRPYAGFVENLYATEWTTTPLTELTQQGEFSFQLDNLEENTRYEFRAVVIHPKMRIYGDTMQSITAKQ